MPKDILNIVFAPKKFSQITEANEILTWDEARKKMHLYHSKPFLIGNPKLVLSPTPYPYKKADPKHEVLCNLLCLWWGDITKCKIEAIVNSANAKLSFGIYGGGVCGAVHRVAGPQLSKQCDEMYPNGCKVTECAVTDAFKLPSKYVIHAVGPSKIDLAKLSKTYKNVIAMCIEHKIKQICFCSIGCGTENIPIEQAAKVAVYSVIKCLLEPCCSNDEDMENEEAKENDNDADANEENVKSKNVSRDEEKTSVSVKKHKTKFKYEYFDKNVINCWTEKELMAYKHWLIEQLG